MVVVNQSESSASATTKLGLQTVDRDAVFLDFKLLSELLLELGLCDASQLRVDNLDLLQGLLRQNYLRPACGQARDFS